MNGKKKQTHPNLPSAPQTGCICQGFGPLLTEFLRHFGPPEEARRHFASARLEVLKGLRALLDARIEQVAKVQGSAKGEKIPVE
jgi:hypothetical protein